MNNNNNENKKQTIKSFFSGEKGKDNLKIKNKQSPSSTPKTITQFLKDKNKSPLYAMEKYGPDILGEDQWTLGLISILNGKNVSEKVTVKSIRELLHSLNRHSSEDSPFINFIDAEINKNLNSFSANIINAFVSTVSRLKLIKHKNPRIRHLVRTFLEKIKYAKNAPRHNKSNTLSVELEANKNTRKIGDTSKTFLKTQKPVIKHRNPELPLTFDFVEKPSVITYFMTILMQEEIKNNAPSSLIYTLLEPEVIERKMRLNKLLDRKITAPLALIIHPSATHIEKLKESFDVYYADTESIHHIRAFLDQYIKLLLKGYEEIFVFLPDKEYWADYHYAKHAAKDLTQFVKLFPLPTFGTGISQLTLEIMKEFLKNPQKTRIPNIISQKAPLVRNWVISYDLVTCQELFWFNRLADENLKKRARKQTNKCPIFALHQPFRILGVGNNVIKALEFLEKVIIQDCKTRNYQPNKIIISYSINNHQLITWAKKIKKFFPKTEIALIVTKKVLIKEFGNHISLSLF
jgi:hypothetical protein